MSNYEHIFESAIDFIKSGKDFYYFKSDKNVAKNVYDIVPKDIEDRAYMILDILEGIWSIANYVYSEYMGNCPHFEKDCANAGTYLCEDCKVGEYYD